MQLKDKNKTANLRAALSAATCGLLGVAPNANALGTDSPWEFDTTTLFYTESDDRVSLVEPVIRARKELGDDEFITAKLVADLLTGASPNGATPTASPQTFTTPSGNGTFTTSGGDLPIDDTFRDSRFALSTEWEKPFSRTTRGVFGANASTEFDFFSIGANATLAKDFNRKNTTLSIGAAFENDSIDPVGGAPIPLATMELPGQPQNKRGTDSKNVVDVLLGWTQVMSERTVMQFNYSFSQSDGYLNDPYKVISVIDATPGQTQGDAVEYRFENRPDQRAKHSLFWKTAHHFGEDVVDVSYRFLTGDWGVDSHTLDFRYRYQWGKSYWQPHLRYYTQSAADFYRTNLMAGSPLPAEVSADYRLGDLDSFTVGLKFGRPLYKKQELGLRVELIKQLNDPSSGSGIGSQAAQDLVPDTDAFIVQLNYSVLW